MAGQTVSVELSGPLFQRDPGKTLRGNIQQMMEGVAQEGEAAVRKVLEAGNSGRAPIAELSPDHVSEHVIGRVKSLSNKHWLATAVISANTGGMSAAGAKSFLAAASLLESRLHAFKRTAQALRTSRAVLQANLAAGLD